MAACFAQVPKNKMTVHDKRTFVWFNIFFFPCVSRLNQSLLKKRVKLTNYVWSHNRNPKTRIKTRKVVLPQKIPQKVIYRHHPHRLFHLHIPLTMYIVPQAKNPKHTKSANVVLKKKKVEQSIDIYSFIYLSCSFVLCISYSLWIKKKSCFVVHVVFFFSWFVRLFFLISFISFHSCTLRQS